MSSTSSQTSASARTHGSSGSRSWSLRVRHRLFGHGRKRTDEHDVLRSGAGHSVHQPAALDSFRAHESVLPVRADQVVGSSIAVFHRSLADGEPGNSGSPPSAGRGHPRRGEVLDFILTPIPDTTENRPALSSPGTSSPNPVVNGRTRTPRFWVLGGTSPWGRCWTRSPSMRHRSPAASEELTATATQLSGGAEDTAAQAALVASASEQIAASIESVASSTEEMTASINEIAPVRRSGGRRAGGRARGRAHQRDRGQARRVLG